ncbi:probable myosin light chain kinase DDB_G0279831 [Contarinia nasturtii]|uniref:probable myosin light chain kinase DDB_G0279831 n=1 Tax=Contarinia nasturtii TaxID=265458 RepID=UPI0012D3C306|nr:probable myosin light chain kinase DDB_G0279831 [Contarinia nasturtii]
MNSTIESSSIVGMAAPPPPPPPPPPMLNGIENGRSQLLADIRKGSTLKKAPNLNDSNHNELSASDKLKKQTQDLLQAELTSTLKRRKPIVINEPPKYEYPTYNDNNENNANVSNKNNESSHSIANTTNVTKPLNVNAVLSVVSGIKIPDVQYDAKSSTALKTQSNEKPKISHGKPNFMINTKEIKPINGNESTSLKTKIKSPEINETKKLHRPSFFTKTNNLTTVYKSSAKPTVEPNSAESQVEKCKSIFLIKTQNIVDDSPSKPSPKLQQKTDLISKFENIPTTKGADQQLPNKKITENVKKSSVDETNGISFANVANKKALFEQKPEQTTPKLNGLKNTVNNSEVSSKPTAVAPILNGKYSTLNSPRMMNQTKPGVTTVTLNKNATYGPLGRPLVAANDRVDHHFERTVHTVNETTSTINGKYETKQFEQKTIVSFSKDLHSATNKYPEQIRVKKTMVTERSAIQDNPFQNIRFSIKTDGNVIPKAK